MEKKEKLTVVHEHCTQCGCCVMMGYACTREGKKYILDDLPQEQWAQAEACCPFGAIVVVEQAPAEACSHAEQRSHPELDSGSHC